VVKMNIVSAKRAAEFANIQKTDNRGRVTSALVPGHGGTWYEVLIRRYKKKGVQVIGTSCTCTKDKTPCKGNANQLCYHSLAALLAGAEKTKVKISFCEDKEAAEKLTNIGGASYAVQSLQSDKTVWMIAKDEVASMPC
jgi:hypothetical protein